MLVKQRMSISHPDVEGYLGYAFHAGRTECSSSHRTSGLATSFGVVCCSGLALVFGTRRLLGASAVQSSQCFGRFLIHYLQGCTCCYGRRQHSQGHTDSARPLHRKLSAPHTLTWHKEHLVHCVRGKVNCLGLCCTQGAEVNVRVVTDSTVAKAPLTKGSLTALYALGTVT